MFIVQGVTLLVMDKPGGMIAAELCRRFFVGDAIPDLLPVPVVLARRSSLALWLLAASDTRFGIALYAIGSDEEAARAAGVPADAHAVLVYVLAGVLYGAAGVFISAQTGSGDPLVGNPMLLQMFAAVVVGGTLLGGGRGGVRRLDRRRLHPDARRQHPARPQRLGLLQHHRRGRDPDPGRAAASLQPALGHRRLVGGAWRSCAPAAGGTRPSAHRGDAAAPLSIGRAGTARRSAPAVLARAPPRARSATSLPAYVVLRRSC